MKATEQRTLVAGRYALQSPIADAPAGVAWLANDVVLDRRVILEILRPDAADDVGVAAGIDETARSLARVDAHVLAALLDGGVQDGLPFIVTEHVPGTTLAETVRDEGPLDPADAVGPVFEVLDGLEEAHAAGVLHLALRPRNVVLTPEGVRLTGAGFPQALVKAGRSADAATHTVTLPPEAASGHVDERADVWSVGALLFELLTGRSPSSAARFVRAERRDVPRALDAVIARALAPDPVDRYPDVAALRDALVQALPPVDADAAMDGTTVPRGVFRTWLAVPLLVAIVAAAVVAAGLWLGRLELGGPVGVRLPDEPAEDTPSPVTTALSVASIAAYDPAGDGHENDHNVGLAIDGDRDTAWRSENYFDGVLHKDGVGLLLDLGETREVTTVRVSTSSPGFRFTVVVGDDPSPDLGDTPDTVVAQGETRVPLDGARGRYVLVWITTVVPTGDGNRAEVGEVRLLGPA